MVKSVSKAILTVHGVEFSDPAAREFLLLYYYFMIISINYRIINLRILYLNSVYDAVPTE
jgi:hypothetical protein